MFDSVTVVKSLPALHYSVDYIFLSFGIMYSIVELWYYLTVADKALLVETS